MTPTQEIVQKELRVDAEITPIIVAQENVVLTIAFVLVTQIFVVAVVAELNASHFLLILAQLDRLPTGISLSHLCAVG